MNLRIARKLENVLIWDASLRFKDYRKSVWLKVNKRLNRLQPVYRNGQLVKGKGI